MGGESGYCVEVLRNLCNLFADDLYLASFQVGNEPSWPKDFPAQTPRITTQDDRKRTDGALYNSLQQLRLRSVLPASNLECL